MKPVRKPDSALVDLLRRRASLAVGVDPAHDAGLLTALGREAHHIAEQYCSDERYCNGGTYDSDCDKILRSAATIAKPYDLRVSISGDPRGFCLHLHGEGVRGNTWGGDEAGYGV